MFTPGPWRADRAASMWHKRGPDDRNGVNAVVIWHERSSGGCSPVAWVSPYLYSQDPIADARLIAAAPDLYEALKKFLDSYLRLVNSGDCGNWNPETEAVVIAARAALQRAEQP